MEKSRRICRGLILIYSGEVFTIEASRASWGANDSSSKNISWKKMQLLNKFGRNNSDSGGGFGYFFPALSQSEFTSHFRSG